MTVKKIRIAHFLVFIQTLSVLASAAEWQVGVARTDITPREMLWMAGFAGREHPPVGTLQPLMAKALLIEDSRAQRIVIVTLDLIGDNFPRRFSEAVARRVQQLTGIERKSILFNFSHSHGGPVTSINDGALVTYGLSAQQCAAVDRYTQVVQDKLVALIVEASKTLHPARLAYGRSQATFAMNRRKSRNPDGPVDFTVPVLRVSDEDDKLLAVVFGYACHATSLSSDIYQYHGDYPGFAQAALETTHPGITAMFMAGCGGDINADPRGTLELSRKHGNSLAAAVDSTLVKKMSRLNGPLAVAFDRVDLPFVDPPSREELKNRIGQGDIFEQRLTKLLIKRIDEQGAIESKYAYPVQVVRFGDDLTLVAMGGETVVDYALRIRREFDGNGLWVAGYSNEVFAYIPSERVLAEGGYEAGGAMKYFGIHGPFKPGVEDRVIGLVKKLQ